MLEVKLFNYWRQSPLQFSKFRCNVMLYMVGPFAWAEFTQVFCLLSYFVEGNLGNYLSGHSVYSIGFSLQGCIFD